MPRPEPLPLHPKHWPVWMVVGLLWLLSHLPYRWQLFIGKKIGQLAFYFAKREREIAQINLEKCFPHYPSFQRTQLLRKSFINMGIGAMETAFGWFASTRRLAKLGHIEGMEHVHHALQKNKGVLLCTLHMSPLHIVGRLLNMAHPFGVMYFPPKNPVFRAIRDSA